MWTRIWWVRPVASRHRIRAAPPESRPEIASAAKRSTTR